MNNAKLLLMAFIIITNLSFSQRQMGNYQDNDSITIRYDLRKLDKNRIPPEELYKKSKQEVFPVGYTENSGSGVWTELNPKLPRVNYIGLHFMNNDTGWACGGSGAVIKTTDGGNYWTVSETPVTNLLLKLDSFDGQNVIVTGYNGIILRSTDNGESFDQVASGVTTDLWGVKMVNDTVGWICGTNWTLLKTTDAGLSWQSITAGLNDHYWAVDFIDSNNGMIACGGGKVLKTTDGGMNWATIQAGDERALFTIDMIDSLHIAAAGLYGKNVYSSDGGNNWIINPDIPAFTATNWIDFIDADTGYSVQDVTDIKKTTDRGVTWFDPLTNIFLISEWHIQAFDSGVVYSCGEEINGQYALNFLKKDGWNQDWEKLFLNDSFKDVFFIDEFTGYFISNDIGGGIYKTEDGGETLRKIPDSPIRADLLFLDSLTGFAGGNNKTTDGGETWYNTNGGGNNKVFFINNTTGWSIDASHIYKTTDTGENWTEQPQPGASNNRSIFFIDSLNGWVASQFIWQTTNSGDTWIKRDDIPITYSHDIYFINYLKGWVLAENKFYYTEDGGQSWMLDPQIIYFTSNFETISNSHFIITGSNIYESVDTGQTWQNITSQVGSNFTSLHAPTEYLAYGVGPYGYIVSYLDTSIIPVELTNFSAENIDDNIVLKWITASETNNLGYEILRSTDSSKWINIGFVQGRGTTTEKSEYSFIDKQVNNKKLYYKIKQIDLDGSYSFSEILEIEILIKSFFLSQNYPNPANPITNIKYSVPVKSQIKIELYSTIGELIRTIISEEKEEGIYNLEVDLSNLSSGVYFYRLISDKGFASTKKLIVLK